MDMGWLRDLNSLSKTGNFSRAAELNNISQPAFSRRIKALENWVGVRLVDRSSHPVKLTEAGAQILEAGNQAMNRLEAEREQIREAEAQPDKYVITFATQHSIGWRFYPAWLQALENSFGPILSRLRADDLPNCLEALGKGEADFVLSYGSEYSAGVYPAPEMEIITIGRDELVPVSKCKPNGKPLYDLSDKSRGQIPYLRFGSSAPIGDHIKPLLGITKLDKRLEVVYENSMAGALRVRARDGAGVAWLPRSLVQPDIEAGLLILTGEAQWKVSLDIQLLRNKLGVNSLTGKIWTFLALRRNVPLI